LWEQPGSNTEADAAQVRFQKMKDREERKKKIKLEEVGAKEENRGGQIYNLQILLIHQNCL